MRLQKLSIKRCFVVLVAILAISGASFAQTNDDPSRINVYITPFYNSKGPTVDVGQFSKGLADTNSQNFVATITKMKKSWKKLTFPEMYVASIRLYDEGYRDEAAYWFYSAQYRARVFAAVVDREKMGGIGDPGFELVHASAAFHQLVGPYINGYSFGDPDKLITMLEHVGKENEAIPDLPAVYRHVQFKPKTEWPAANKDVNDGLGKLALMVKEQKASLKQQRMKSGVEAQFSKLTSKEFPPASSR